MKKGLYIHIPFCSQICSYCDFAKLYYQEDLANKYIDEVIKEIEEKNCREISSIYIGGGTPTSLNAKQLKKLLSYLDNHFYHENMSFTIEANAENLDEEKIQLLVKYHVNRISIGVQTFNDDLIKVLNRKHNFEMIKEKINLLNKYHLKDINCDLIYGLPGQSIEMLDEDLTLMLSLNITHISTYALSINKNTLLYLENIKEVEDDTYRKYYDFINYKLKESGYIRYEVSNFAKQGFESDHNLIYWKNKEYYGIGLGASGYVNNVRYDNTKSLNNYLSGKREVQVEPLTILDEEFYYLMLGLRLTEGIDMNEYKSLYSKDLLVHYQDKIQVLLDKKLIEIKDNFLKISEENLYIMDYILKKLLY